MEHRIVKGISEGFHDASVSLVKYDGNAEILWCKQAERITRKKNERFNEYIEPKISLRLNPGEMKDYSNTNRKINNSNWVFMS